MNPFVDFRDLHVKQFAHDFLQGIGLQVHQNEHQPIFRQLERRFAPPPIWRWRG